MLLQGVMSSNNYAKIKSSSTKNFVPEVLFCGFTIYLWFSGTNVCCMRRLKILLGANVSETLSNGGVFMLNNKLEPIESSCKLRINSLILQDYYTLFAAVSAVIYCLKGFLSNSIRHFSSDQNKYFFSKMKDYRSYELNLSSSENVKTTDQLPVVLIAQLVRALNRYRSGHGFESRSSLNFFQALFSQLLKLSA